MPSDQTKNPEQGAANHPPFPEDVTVAEKRWGIKIPTHLVSILHSSPERLMLTCLRDPSRQIIIKQNTVTIRCETVVIGQSAQGKRWSRKKYENVLIGWLRNNRQKVPTLRFIKSVRPKGARQARTKFREVPISTLEYGYSFMAYDLAQINDLCGFSDGSINLPAYAVHEQLLAAFLAQRYETITKQKLPDSTKLINLMYPSLNFLEDEPASDAHRKHVPRLLRNTITDDNYKPLLAHYVGRKNVRKDLLKAVSGHIEGSDWLFDAKLLMKAGFPIDWIIEFIKLSDIRFHTETKIILPLLVKEVHAGRLTPAKAKKFLLDLIKLTNKAVEESRDRNPLRYIMTTFTDTVYMMQSDNMDTHNENGIRLPAVDYKNLKALHDSLTERDYYRSLNLSPLPEQLYDEYVNQHVYEHTGIQYKIIRPETELDLREWGKEAANCIGSYTQRVRNQYTNLYAVYNVTDGNKLYLTIEVSNDGHLRQAMEYGNRQVNNEHWTVLSTLFEEASQKLEAAQQETATA